MIKKILILLFTMTMSISKLYVEASTPKVRFAFLTDVHLNIKNENDRYNGLLQALKVVKESEVDFVLIGGDVVDVSGMGSENNKQVADSLYVLYKNTFDKLGVTYFPTLGNHDLFFDTASNFVEGDELFKTYFGKSYYTFEKNGILFFVLNSLQSVDGRYPSVGTEQLAWISKILDNTPKEKPIVISTHVPIYSIYYPVVENRYVKQDVIDNYKDVLKVFENHNLRLVLQGHQHLYEEIYSQKVQYITGGAICAGWWQGPFFGTEEGFLVVEVNDKDEFSWSYVDYDWTARK